MNIKIASNVLRQLQAKSQTPEVRVASRWIMASMDTDYDIMLRLQVLEGAAGFPEFSDRWWKGGRVNLGKAKAFFEKESVQEDWFSAGNTGMITALKNSVQKAIRQYKITSDPYDFINNALMGLPLKSKMDEAKRTQQIPLIVGAKLSDGIRTGKETPQKVATGMLARYLWNRISTEAKGQHAEQFGETEEGATVMPEPKAPELDAATIIHEIIFKDLSDPLGQKIRQFMRTFWNSKGRAYAPMMNAWLDEIEKGRTPLKRDIAEAGGIAFSAFASRYWNPAWQDFWKALWQNDALLKELQDRYEQEGAVWFQKKPDIFKLLPQRIRASELADRWLQRQ